MERFHCIIEHRVETWAKCIDGCRDVPIKNMPPTSANELRRIESEKSAAFVADFCVCCCTGEYYIKRFAQSGAFLLAPSASRRLLENKHRERGVRADIEGNLCGECSVRMLIHTMGW
jgi:hypothetical protein